MSKKYKTKPCEIEAVKYTGGRNSVLELLNFAGDSITWDDHYNPIIHTLEGDMMVLKNDYVIRGLNGEFYLCKPDIFEKKYELIEE